MKAQAKGDDEFHRQGQVFLGRALENHTGADTGFAVDQFGPLGNRADLLEAQEEVEGQRRDDVKGECRADEKHDRRSDKERQERVLFVLVEARCHKPPHLAGNIGEGQGETAQKRNADGDEEAFLRLDELQFTVLSHVGQRAADRVCQEIEDRVPDGETDHHADDKGDGRTDQPGAQFGQMLDQRG